MIWIFLIIIILVLIGLTRSNTAPVKSNNTLIRQTVDFNLKDYPNDYEFSVSGVHLEPYIFPVINYCKKHDLITLVPEPYNKHDSEAIKVKSSGWVIGYVPTDETYEVQAIIKKDHISYIDKISIDGYIMVNVKIKFK